MRQFSGNATRDTDDGKLDFEGFISPEVLLRYAEYMHKNRQTADGVRDSDNWQDGIPKSVYMKSLWRHFMDLWLHHRGKGHKARESLEDALCGVMFNVQGYLFEVLRPKMSVSPDELTDPTGQIQWALQDGLDREALLPLHRQKRGGRG